MQSGTKLLYAEVKIALRLIKKTLHGHSLTRSASRTLWLSSWQYCSQYIYLQRWASELGFWRLYICNVSENPSALVEL